MNKALTIILSMIAGAVMLAAAVFIFNPLNLRNLIIGSIVNHYLTGNTGGIATSTQETASTTNIKAPTAVKNLLTPDQKKTLESYGIDVNKLPTTVTPAMQKCFIDKLGEARAIEIVKGAKPTLLEVLSVKTCLGM